MYKNLIIISFLLFLSISTFGQEQKIFYDKDWKVCSQSKAAYYRLITFDVNEKPTGKVKDFYITGELQWEGQYSYVDKYDNSKDLKDGFCTWYYKSGMKAQETLYKNGIPDGTWIQYYESGKVMLKTAFKDGKPIDKWYVECDEFENCQRVFFEGFGDKGNYYNWPLTNQDNCESEIIDGKGLRMKTSSTMGFAQVIYLPIDISNDFSIETIINFIDGDKQSSQGLIWGMKDWENYNYFYISANGYYNIGAKSEGLSFEFRKWTFPGNLNQNSSKNLIKVNKIKDKVYFSINGQIIDNADFYAFRGNNVGFQILSGKKEVYFEKLLVRQNVIGDGTISPSNSSNSTWKGNGTGFFIDTKGYIVTNYHVIENASEIGIDFVQNGKKISYKAICISSDKQNDLAIIKIEDPKFTGLSKLPYNFKIQISDVGSNVFVLGYPMALSIMGEEIKFTDGKISSKTGFQGDVSTYQISVPLQPGNSGGPLFDYDGNVIGIVNAKIMAADNVSYAIKTSYLNSLIEVLPETLILPRDNSLSNKILTEKIKILTEFVVMVKIK